MTSQIETVERRRKRGRLGVRRGVHKGVDKREARTIVTRKRKLDVLGRAGSEADSLEPSEDLGLEGEKTRA